MPEERREAECSDGRPQRMGGGVVDESNAFCIVYDWERSSLTSGRATWSSTTRWSSQPALRKELKFGSAQDGALPVFKEDTPYTSRQGESRELKNSKALHKTQQRERR